MSDDISWCADAYDIPCEHHDCERHPCNIVNKWRPQSYMSFRNTDFCKERGRKMKDSFKINESAPIINPILSPKTMKVVRNDKVIIVPQKNIYATEKDLAEVRRRTKEQLDENGIAILPCGYTAKVIGNDYVMEVYE